MTDIVDRLTYRAENLWADVRPHAAILDLEAAAEILRLREMLEKEMEVAKVNQEFRGGLIDEVRRLKERVFELESERAEDHSTTERVG